MKTIVSVLFLFLLVYCGSGEDSRKYKIKKGGFQASIVETGELKAVNSRGVVMPWLGWKYGRPKIIELVDQGTIVKEGDVIVKIDQSGIMKYLKDKESGLESAKADFKKMRIEHETRRQQSRAGMNSAKARYDMDKLQLQKFEFESEKKRKQSELQFKKATIEFEKTKRKIEFTKTVLENESKIKKLKIFQLENEIKAAHAALEKTIVKSPINGIVQIERNWRTKKRVKVGDELWPGAPIASIPDLSRMKVKAAVNEADIKKVNLNQKVTVRLDAFPDLPFDGSIIEIAKLCREKEKNSLIKLFDIEILLEKSDPVLKPGMTVSCEIFTASFADAFFIENDCISKEGYRNYIYLKKGTGREKVEVKKGPSNNKHTVISGSFEEGDDVEPLKDTGEA